MAFLRWILARFLILIAFAAMFFLFWDWLGEWRERMLAAALTLCLGEF